MASLRPVLLAAALCAAALLPAVAAHGFAPLPPDEFRTLIQDRDDDCGPEAGPGAAPGQPGNVGNDCHGSHSLVGLILKEAWDGSQDQLVFRFYLDRGYTFPITDTLTLKTPIGTKTLAIKTSDDHSFTVVSGFDSVAGAVKAEPAPSSTRFLVDATVSFASLGVATGDKISDFKVESKSGNNLGDFMPGGCHNTIGDCSAGNAGEYLAGPYTLSGAAYYVKLDDDGAATVDVGSEHIVQLTLANQLRTEAQTFTLSMAGANGVQARFHNPSSPGGEGYSDTISVDVPKGGQGIAHVAVQGIDAGASGTLKVTVLSNLGGRTQHDVGYTVTQGAAGSTTSSSGGSSKGSPALGPVLPLAALAALALLRRRRA